MDILGTKRMPLDLKAAFCGLLLLLSISLFGCSGQILNNEGTGGGAEILTDSDESDARKRARIRLELATGYFEQGQTTIALDELKQSIAVDPTYSEGYNLRGLIYMRLNDTKFADESFRKALAINPRDSNVMHNLGWLLCQQAKYAESFVLFTRAIENPQYGGRSKTYRAQGLCQVRAGLLGQAEASLLKSYEFDAGNPITIYNLTSLLLQKADYVRAQFYSRRLNNSELANAESLWLGVKIERRMENRDAMLQLAAQLLKRFPQSKETAAYQRGAFDE